jgi:GR25 family glycosyltransferase involved in LPS biosynthesis
MSEGEIGISLSHYYLWKNMIINNIQTCLVLEDDARNVHSNFEDIFINTMNNVPLDWDIVLFGFWLHRGEKGKKINNNIWKVKDFVLAHCYLINIKCVKKLMSLLPINEPLDTWLSSQTDNINIYRHNILRIQNSKRPSSSLIRQIIIKKQIKNTNNWNY